MKKSTLKKMIREEIQRVSNQRKSLEENNLLSEGLLTNLVGWLWSGKKDRIIKSIEKKYGKAIPPGLSQRIDTTTDEIIKLRKELEAVSKDW